MRYCKVFINKTETKYMKNFIYSIRCFLVPKRPLLRSLWACRSSPCTARRVRATLRKHSKPESHVPWALVGGYCEKRVYNRTRYKVPGYNGVLATTFSSSGSARSLGDTIFVLTMLCLVCRIAPRTSGKCISRTYGIQSHVLSLHLCSRKVTTR